VDVRAVPLDTLIDRGGHAHLSYDVLDYVPRIDALLRLSRDDIPVALRNLKPEGASQEDLRHLDAALYGYRTYGTVRRGYGNRRRRRARQDRPSPAP
jgi:hypothetical protein